jgi:hypothetical protein
LVKLGLGLSLKEAKILQYFGVYFIIGTVPWRMITADYTDNAVIAVH